ncbi:hypothetical protein F5Y09DRAFT_104512 [Xylaria sp. FL1042]|nr:hypothetical protein F5Y09DRAFT_104512 [Xylaria sp. FL1042]
MSSGWKDVMKNGWHPEKSGSSLKSQVKGLVGRGDTSSSSSREGYVPAPRSSLRDPSSFGPPPKHVAVYGPTPTAQQQHTQAQAPSSQPYSQTQHVEEEAAAAAAAAAEVPPPEPKPYRVDTTGLTTSHLPPPPTRYSNGQTPQPPPARPATTTPTPTQPSAIAAKPKAAPSLPPRLPPRSGNSTPTPSPTSADGQTASQGYLNQGAVNRLGAAGISVPGFGIGGGGAGGVRTPPPPLPPAGARPGPPSTASPTQAPGYGQTEELQARFARMGAPSSPEVGAGDIAANRAQQPSTGQVPSVLGKKKPPPPPPKSKKPGLSDPGEAAEAPPPIPLATRPRFD